MAENDLNSKSSLAPFLEHTLLRPAATSAQIIILCQEAIEHCFAAVCVNPNMVGFAADVLSGTGIPIAAVANFPLGTSTWNAVVREVETSIRDGASHIDLVLPLSPIFEGRLKELEQELRGFRESIQSGISLKCIVELSLLPVNLWPTAMKLVRQSGSQYFKTGTGFFGGVTIEMIQKLREIDSTFPIKAAGGISTREQAFALLKAGANLLGHPVRSLLSQPNYCLSYNFRVSGAKIAFFTRKGTFVFLSLFIFTERQTVTLPLWRPGPYTLASAAFLPPLSGARPRGKSLFPNPRNESLMTAKITSFSKVLCLQLNCLCGPQHASVAALGGLSLPI